MPDGQKKTEQSSPWEQPETSLVPRKSHSKRLVRMELELARIDRDMQAVVKAQQQLNERFVDFGAVVTELTRQVVHHRADVERLELRAEEAIITAQRTLNLVGEHIDWEQKRDQRSTKRMAILLRNLVLIGGLVAFFLVILDALYTHRVGKSFLTPLLPSILP